MTVALGFEGLVHQMRGAAKVGRLIFRAVKRCFTSTDEKRCKSRMTDTQSNLKKFYIR